MEKVEDPKMDVDWVKEQININKIYFDTNMSKVPHKSMKNIDNVADILNKYPKAKISIVGVADRRGSAKANQKLSLKRAKAVQGILKKLGVAESQMKLNPIGEVDSSTKTKADLWMNRRVEFKFLEALSH